MSNNRKCDYLVVDYSYNSKDKDKSFCYLLGISESLNTDDIILLKKVNFIDFDNLKEKIKNICFEFNVDNMIVNAQGFGEGVFELLKDDIYFEDINVNKVIPICYSISNALMMVNNNFRNRKIRLFQAYNNTIHSYRKSFLGYSNILDYHKETDKLVDEINDFKIRINNSGFVIQDYDRKNKYCIRFYCLLYYYIFKNENKLKCKEKLDNIKKTIQNKIFNDIFYKYILIAIENKNIKINYYCNSYNLVKYYITDILKKNRFKMLFNNKIKNKINNKNEFFIELKNSSKINFLKATNYARGDKCDYGIFDKNIDKKLLNNLLSNAKNDIEIIDF